MAMEEGSTNSAIAAALSRMEKALARIEYAARRSSAADPSLKARHDQLKTSVAGALADLDALIAEHR